MRGTDSQITYGKGKALICACALIASALFASCDLFFHKGETLPLPPVETARVVEQRLGADGSPGASYLLASLSGSSADPCLDVQARTTWSNGCAGAVSGADESAILIAVGTAAPDYESGAGCDIYFGYDEPLRLLCRSASLCSSTPVGEGSYDLVSTFGEGRFCLTGAGAATSYSISSPGPIQLGNAALGSITGKDENRSFLGLAALPGAGYAALAWDGNLGTAVCSFLDADLTVTHAYQNSTIDSGDSAADTWIAAGEDGTVVSLEGRYDAGWALSCLSGTGATSSLQGSSSDLNYAQQVVWAGDRYWVLAHDGLYRITLDGVSSRFPWANPGDGEYAILGAPDGGFAVYGPLEPIRDGEAASPPYDSARLLVWRYDKDGESTWKAEWTPSTPSRILDAAADSGGLSVFVCERP